MLSWECFKLQGCSWAIDFLFWRRYSQQAQTSQPSAIRTAAQAALLRSKSSMRWSDDLSLDPLVHLHKHVHSWGPNPKQPPGVQKLAAVLIKVLPRKKIHIMKTFFHFKKFINFRSSMLFVQLNVLPFSFGFSASLESPNYPNLFEEQALQHQGDDLAKMFDHPKPASRHPSQLRISPKPHRISKVHQACHRFNT